MGDSVAESIGVYAEPEVFVKRITPNDKYLVIASDGVFEFLSNENVLEIVHTFQDPGIISRTLVAESYRLWLQYEIRTDDITCIVIKLNGVKGPYVDFDASVSESFIQKIGTSRPVRRNIAKAKRLEVNSGDKQKLTNEELNFVPPTQFNGTAEERRRLEEAVRANFLFQHLNAKQREGVFNRYIYIAFVTLKLRL